MTLNQKKSKFWQTDLDWGHLLHMSIFHGHSGMESAPDPIFALRLVVNVSNNFLDSSIENKYSDDMYRSSPVWFMRWW